MVVPEQGDPDGGKRGTEEREPPFAQHGPFACAEREGERGVARDDSVEGAERIESHRQDRAGTEIIA